MKNVDQEDVRQLCKCLSKARLDNRQDWINLGLCLKRIGAPCSLWDEVSKKSEKYKPRECEQLWYCMKPKSLGIGSLILWAKRDNLAKYDEIKPTLRMIGNIFEDDQKHESVEINTRYLVPRDGKYSKDQQTFQDIVGQFEQREKLKTLIVRSAYNTGKTTFLQDLLREPQKYKRVLFITYRQTLARDIDRNFKKLGFKNYLDGYEDPKVWNSERLIVQLDSLLNVMLKNDQYNLTDVFNGKYDMIVLDEVESLLMHLDEGTMKGKEIITFNFFDELLKLSSKVICLDGDMSNRTLAFMRNYGDFKYIKNTYQDTSKRIRLMVDENAWCNRLNDDIVKSYEEDPKFRICIVCQGSGKAEQLKRGLQNQYPHLKVMKLVGSDSSMTKKLVFENINETLQDVNIFIYSPVIESGVDITIPVKKVYGALSCGSNSQRAYLQMLARCRCVQDGEIPVLNDMQFKINSNYNFWKFKEVEELNREKVSSNGGLEFEVNGDEITLTERDAKRKTISIYNTVEKLNKHPSVFINYLRVLARGKGYGFEIDEEIEEGSGEKGEKANSKIVNTMEAKEIDEDEYETLRRKRKAGKTTSEENFAIEKHYWQKFFVSQELDEKLLKHYMYDNVFNNFLGLIDLENHRKADTLESQRFVERVGLVRELLTGLGFTSPLDHLAVERKTFLVNFMMNIVEGRSFANNFKTNELFGLSKGNRIDSEMSEDRVRNWVNRILKQFSLRVVAQGNGFGLEQLGEILEIIKRKNRIGKNFEDSANLLKQKRRPKQDLDTSKLDPFIDDEPEPKPVVVKQQAAVKPLPPKRGKDVPVWIPESDDEEPVKPKPKPKPKPVVEDLFMDDEPKPVVKQQPVVKPKKVRSARFIPDLDW